MRLKEEKKIDIIEDIFFNEIKRISIKGDRDKKV